MDLLVECDLVSKHQFGKNLAQYEKSYGYKQHDHLICTDCHKVVEFCDPRIQNIQNTVEEILHFNVMHHSLILYATCTRENCENQKDFNLINGMNFKHEIKNNTLILRLAGDLIGEDSGATVVEVATDAIQQSIKKCIVDISGLRYINSSGIGLLITILTKFRNKGGEVYLMKPSESVQKLLVITKLNAIFQIVQSEEEVLKK